MEIQLTSQKNVQPQPHITKSEICRHKLSVIQQNECGKQVTMRMRKWTDGRTRVEAIKS